MVKEAVQYFIKEDDNIKKIEFNEEDQKNIINLYKNNVTQIEIAKKYNVCVDIISRFLKNNNIEKPKENLIGKRYGRLVVKEMLEDSNCLCACDCEKEKIVKKHNLKSGYVKSCGCLSDETRRNRRKGLEGKVFGRLLVIEEFYNSFNGNWECKCKCSCGNFITVDKSNLKKGYTKSCGCYKKEKGHEKLIDLTGKRFGKLMVNSFNCYKGRNNYWNCACDCGNTTIVSSNKLCSGVTKSCGCIGSLGELKVAQILLANKIPFQKEVPVNIKLPTGGHPRFDFQVEYNNQKYFIEYDGWQHFYKSTGNWDNDEKFEKRKNSDKIKNSYCLNNNIPLIRISFKKYNDLSLKDLLLETSEYIVKQ